MVNLKSLLGSINIGLVNLILAIFIVLIGIVIAKFFGKLIQRVLNKLELNKTLNDAIGLSVSLEQFIGSFVRYTIYLIAIILALNRLGLSSVVLYIVLFIIFIFIIIFVILALKDYIPNLFASIYIHRKKILQKGDKINIDNIEGIVQDFDISETKIITKDKDTIFIPNSLLTKKLLIRKKK